MQRAQHESGKAEELSPELQSALQPLLVGLESLSEQIREWQIIGGACDGQQAVQETQKLRPELILLDIGMPTLNGIEAAKKSLNSYEVQRYSVTQEDDPDVLATALSNGGKGLVLKVNAGQELLPAVEAVLERRRFVGFSVKPPHS